MSSLNLGCGKDVRRGVDGWINLDKFKLPGVDVVHNIEEPLPFKDNTFDYVLASHIIEHLGFEKKIFIIEELWRVTKPGGQIEILVPNWSHRNAFIDPTHKSVWEIHTLDYFVPGHWANYYSKARFNISVKEIKGDEKEEIHWVVTVLK